MIDFISSYWYIWLIICLISLGTTIFIEWRQKQSKQFAVTGMAIIGCLVAAFQALGAISAILTIISLILRLIVWKITKN